MPLLVDEALESVTERLDSASEKWWGFSLGTALALAGCLSVATLFVFILSDALLTLPQFMLALMFAFWMALNVGLVVWIVKQSRRGRRSRAATARRVEMEYPEVGSHLINLVQFSDDEATEDGYRQAAMVQAAAAVEEIPFDQAAQRETQGRRLLLCLNTPSDFVQACSMLFGLVVAGILLSVLIPTWTSSLHRILQPWTFVPSVGRVHIVTVTPGDAEVLVGSSVEIVAEIENPAGASYGATLHILKDREAEVTLEMQPDQANQKFAATLPRVDAALRYRLQIGDSQTKIYTLGVRPKPSIAEVEVTYGYPGYLGRAPETITQRHADLEAPQFTIAHLVIRPLTPIAKGHLLVDGKRIPATVMEDGKVLRAQLLLQSNATYTVHVITDAGQTDGEPRVNLIRVAPDLPPTVTLLQPATETAVAVGKMLSLAPRASDDHGLGLVRLEMKRGDEADAKVESLAAWDKFTQATEVVVHHQRLVEKGRFQPGETLFVRAVARDRRQLEIDNYGIKIKLLPQEAVTPWHKVRLISADVQSKEELAQLEVLRATLFKILTQQIQARVAAAKIGSEKTMEAAKPTVVEARDQQVAIQKATLAVVQLIGATDNAERLAIRRAAHKLALGDMVEAVKQADALGRIKGIETLPKSAAILTGTQDRIIDVLRRMLNEVRKETADVLAEMDKKPSTELPSDVQNKLRELKDKLQEFIKQQKKVIEATESLAKKPVEDFSDKDEKKLKDLAAIEDDWSRFLAERHSDFSKLPEQDFSNPSFLDEMIAVETELKMAKDALTKKAADIAVPLEQLGAEMAKEMTTNIEKWLPDTPDRERWSQEEPLTDAMKEAPMAELPKELEDIVGKLMEQEEDLFKELEDMSSSWADSIDKGAGWDAADGPISNMSARGVTGNRLPNTSEISGRSGEGRQGQASGEFVGNEAVGKGGRKTPSRLSPEPFVKGQVKDTSKDPVGGATGGGKESGQGGQGLQGPQPNRQDRELGRLAKKQAELRNKAEAVDLKFKVLRYHHTDLKKLVEMMGAVESDLQAGRYDNALRRREVLLQGLDQVRGYLKGEFAVRKDQTSNLPTDIQKEILGSMQEASPQGWEELNRQYFEQLGRAPAAPVPAEKASTPVGKKQ